MTDDEIDELINSWVLDLEVAKLSRATITLYERGVDAYLEYCDDYECDPTFSSDSVKLFVVAQHEGYGRTVSTAGDYLKGVKRFVAWAVENEPTAVPYSGVDRIPKPALGERIMPAVTEEEHEALLATCDLSTWIGKRDRAILGTLDTSGARISELTSMTLAATDVRARRSMVRAKGDRERIVAFEQAVALDIDRYKRARRNVKGAANETALWLAQGGSPLTSSGVDTMLRRRCEMADIRIIHAHMYRHRWARRYLRKGGQRGDLKILGGWKTDQMVEHYTREDDLERALAAYDELYGSEDQGAQKPEGRRAEGRRRR